MTDSSTALMTSLAAGAVAGLAVDVVFFPLDTIKTRMQAPKGFLAAGGFRGVFNGISSVLIGSAPGASLFFATYDTSKRLIAPHIRNEYQVYLLSASIGEAAACLFRVPTENVKQKMQAGIFSSFKETTSSIMKTRGASGFFVGYWSTLAREIPFSAIQFPLYELFKATWSEQQGSLVSPWQAACCGSAAGGISAFITTPLDVVKTRLMLGSDAAGVEYKGMLDCTKRVFTEGGALTFFNGVVPRTLFITLGGLFFFGGYENTKAFVSKLR
jgi:solute carrier family 25 S-adenosylmethionine transporter 26